MADTSFFVPLLFIRTDLIQTPGREVATTSYCVNDEPLRCISNFRRRLM